MQRPRLSLGEAFHGAGLIDRSLWLLSKKIAPGWRGLALAPSGDPVTRRGYHCRGQPGSADDNLGVVARQNPALTPEAGGSGLQGV